MFVSEKEKRERGEKLVKERKQVLLDLNIPLKSTVHSWRTEDSQIRDEGKLRPFEHPVDGVYRRNSSRLSLGSSDAKVG